MVSTVCIMRRRPLPSADTEVTWHLARGSPDAATIAAHNASCFTWPNDSTVSLEMRNVMNTTSILTKGGGGGGGDDGVRTGPTNRRFQAVAREVSERSLGDATLPLAPARMQPKNTGHCLLRFDSDTLPDATMEYVLLPPGLYE